MVKYYSIFDVGQQSLNSVYGLWEVEKGLQETVQDGWQAQVL